jgi:hypothetical protein
MAPGLVGQTIEQAAGHPRMRAVGASDKAKAAICGQVPWTVGGLAYLDKSQRAL